MRKIRIATVSFEIVNGGASVEDNLERIALYAEQAQRAHADLLCLPETVTTMATNTPHRSDDGTWQRFFSGLAAQHSMAIIAPFLMQKDDGLVNQASIFDKEGRLIGSYEKLQPTGDEAKRIVPGSKLEVFDLGFARVAMMICMDIYFPEIARIYALKGAEILFWPTMTHGPSQEALREQASVRAMDNSLVLVEANYAQQQPYAPYAGRIYPGNARVFDHNGDVIAQTGRRPGIAVAEIDLDEIRKTANCFLIDPEIDDTRRDIEQLVRLDLYSREYAALAKSQHQFYDELHKKK